MLELINNPDFWYSLAMLLIALTAIFGGKYRLKKYTKKQDEEGKNEK